MRGELRRVGTGQEKDGPGRYFRRTRVSRDVSEIRSDMSRVRVAMALGDHVPSLNVPCAADTLLRR